MNKLEYNYGLPEALSLAAQAKRGERASRERLGNIQRKRFSRLIDYSRQHSSFYQRLYQAENDRLTLDQIENLPVVTKATVMENFDDVLTDRSVNKERVLKFAEDPSNLGGMLDGKYFVARTSGTTGMVGHYVHDLFSYFLINALTAARSKGLNLSSFLKRPRRVRVASLLSPTANLGVSSVIASTPKFVRLFSEFKLIDIFEPWDEAVRALNEFQPDVIGSFPTILDQLAESQLRGDLRVRPQTIRSGGETLTPRIRGQIAQAFRCPVYDCYGCAECGWVGMECEERSGIHVFSDWFIVEPVDTNNCPVAPGMESDKILVTNLANFAQPFIRFELPDRVTVLEEACPCGSVLPRILLKGRASEVLYFACESGRKIGVPPFHLTTLAEMVPGIHRYQIIQENDQHLLVLYTARSGDASEEVGAALKASFEGYLRKNSLEPYVSLSVSRTDVIERDPSGKIRQVFSRV